MLDRLKNRINTLSDIYSSGDFYPEVFQAKQEFFNLSGTVHDTDPDYDQRMHMFMNWYLFDRKISFLLMSPIDHYIRQQKSTQNEQDRLIDASLAHSIHSIFSFCGFTWFSKKIVVCDLFTKKRYKIHDSLLSKAFARGDIFEARLLTHEGLFYFADGLCFHPVEMKSFIVNEIKKIKHHNKEDHLQLLLKLAQMKLKHQYFAHIDVRHIYENHSKF